MLHTRRTWFVIADATQAKIFAQAHANERWVGVDQGTFRSPDTSHHARDLGTDRPARSIESIGKARHAIEPKSDARRLAAARFAKDIARFVEQKAADKSYDRLVVAAPPHMLSDLRKAFGRQAKALLVAEVDKDLTKVPLQDLPGHLESVIRP
jgi:protein required for attachment to host cells